MKRGLGPSGRRERLTNQSPGDEGPATGSPRPTVLLRTFVAVRDDEVDALVWACAFVFSLLAGNYLIRPVRDEMGIAGGTDHLPLLFAGTLLAMLAVWPLLSRRLGRRAGLPNFNPVFRILQISLLAFYAAFHLVPG